MRLLVTGHKGYIGTALVPMLKKQGHEVVGIDSDLYRYNTFGDPPEAVEELIKDVRDIVASDLEGFDGVVHLAALSNDPLGNLNPNLTYEINYEATIRIAKLAKEMNVSRFVFFSSCSMYGASGDEMLDESAEFNPVTPYAVSKVRSEADLRGLANDKFSPTYLRNATAYGVSPRIRFDVVINNLTAWAYTTGNVFMKSDGTPWRPVVHIEDISRACIAVLDAPREKVHNEAFNVGLNAENYRIKELAEIVRETVPGTVIEYAEGAGPDKRCYRAEFSKYAHAFPDHPLTWDARRGTKNIYESYRRYGLQKDEYEGPRYKRIAQIRLLLEKGELDDTLRWTR